MNKRIREKRAKKYGDRCPKCGSGNVASVCAIVKRGGQWRDGPHDVSCFTCDPRMREALRRARERARERNPATWTVEVDGR